MLFSAITTKMLARCLPKFEGIYLMNSNPKLSYAIAAILSGCAMSMSPGTVKAAAEAAEAESEGIQEITVTAQRRTENAQNVPITIQAISSEQLKELSIAN